MKKFIFTANVVVLVALVPAVIFGYLSHDDAAKNTAAKTELVKEVSVGHDDGSIFHLVRTF